MWVTPTISHRRVSMSHRRSETPSSASSIKVTKLFHSYLGTTLTWTVAYCLNHLIVSGSRTATPYLALPLVLLATGAPTCWASTKTPFHKSNSTLRTPSRSAPTFSEMPEPKGSPTQSWRTELTWTTGGTFDTSSAARNISTPTHTLACAVSRCQSTTITSARFPS